MSSEPVDKNSALWLPMGRQRQKSIQSFREPDEGVRRSTTPNRNFASRKCETADLAWAASSPQMGLNSGAGEVIEQHPALAAVR